MLMGHPIPVGVQQQRLDDGNVYFTPCSPCPAPTPKTAIVPASPAATPIAADAPTAPPSVRQPPASSTTPREADPARSRPQETLRVLFAYASAKLDAAGRTALATFAGKAKKADKVEVRGFTDSTGNPQLNEILARARAEVVREDLVRQGVDRKRIHTWGCVDCFAASNDDEEGRQANRRVDVILFRK
ncbi:MAG: OmpA family protein [Betaproteobacteria bacterium]